MITDDDRKEAEQHCKTNFGVAVYTYSNGDCEPHPAIGSFLAGVAHGRKSLPAGALVFNDETQAWDRARQSNWGKPHVVAEGELPEVYQDVFVYFWEDRTFQVISLRPNGEWIDSDCFDLPLDVFKRAVKYWWPLPEVEGEK